MAKTLLVIDDSNTIREAIKLALTGEEWQLVCATNGTEATTALQENSVDAILCDVAPGEEDGYELCRNLGASAEGSGLPLLLMGANVNATAALAVGASGTLPKPFEAEQLVRTLADTLEQSDFTFDFDDIPAAPASDFEDLSAAPTEDAPLGLEPVAEALELQPAELTAGEFELDEVEVIDLSDDDEFNDLELLDDLQPVEVTPVTVDTGATEPTDEASPLEQAAVGFPEEPASTTGESSLDDLDLALDSLHLEPIAGEETTAGEESIAAGFAEKPLAGGITIESAENVPSTSHLEESGAPGGPAASSVDDMKIGFPGESELATPTPPEDTSAPVEQLAAESISATEPVDQTATVETTPETSPASEFDLDLGVNPDADPTPLPTDGEPTGINAPWALHEGPIAADPLEIDLALDAATIGPEEPTVTASEPWEGETKGAEPVQPPTADEPAGSGKAWAGDTERESAGEPLQVKEVALENVLQQSTPEFAPELTTEPESAEFDALPEAPAGEPLPPAKPESATTAEPATIEVPPAAWDEGSDGDETSAVEPGYSVQAEPLETEPVWTEPPPGAPDLAATIAANAGQSIRKALEQSLSAEKLAPLIEAAVERVAWEVVPQLAERLIRETIEKLQQEPPTQ